MVHGLKSRGSWILCLGGIITIGILSRVVYTGLAIIDKYLGDALYAAMVYAILRVFWKSAPLAAMVIMTIIELFQLTMIPAHMLTSANPVIRICARLIGTQFSFVDLLSYGVGITCVYLIDSPSRQQSINRFTF